MFFSLRRGHANKDVSGKPGSRAPGPEQRAHKADEEAVGGCALTLWRGGAGQGVIQEISS